MPDRTSELESEAYNLSELGRACRLSRATMRHYEKLGILSPDDSGPVRMARLADAIALRNLGYEPQRIADLVDNDPFSPEHIAAHRRELERRIEYERAQLDCLAEEAMLMERSDEVWVAWRETFLFNPTLPVDSDQGKGEPGTTAMYMPVSGVGGIFEGADFLVPDSLWLGRSVAAQHASLIEGFSDGLPCLGGCMCVHAIFRSEVDRPLSLSGDTWVPVLARMGEEARARGVRITGPAFICRSVVAGGLRYVLVCMPVRRGGFVRRTLNRLRTPR